MNKAILFAFTNIDKGSINAGENIFNGAQVHITNLVTALGNHQLINPFVVENCSDAQLLGDDDLLGHGR